LFCDNTNFFTQAFESWISSLPNKNSPTLLGLPATAENQLQSVLGNKCISHLSAVQATFDAEVAIDSAQEGGQSKTASTLKAILDTVTAWLAALPTEAALPIVASERASDVSASPMERCLAREILKGKAVLTRVRGDLSIVM
jgi:dynein heavy chain 1